MRIAPSLFVLAMTSQAYADTAVSLDFGYVRNRVAVTDQTTLNGESARFGLRISLGRYFHFGAEAEEGRLAGQSSLPNGAVARPSTPEPQGPLDGNTLGLKMFAGAHTNLGRFTVGADLAGGVRDTWVSGDLGPDIAGRKNEPLLELRSRGDFWMTKSTTIGAVASSDLLDRRHSSFAAVFALHFD
ncbi:MAG TPA: hypothetical protein VIV11_32110 [Kofleriaceae bacterium]